MNILNWLAAVAVATVVIISGVIFATPLVFAGRALPGLTLGDTALGGTAHADLIHLLSAYQADLGRHRVTLAFADQTTALSLDEVGVGVDVETTLTALKQITLRDVIYGGQAVNPKLTIDTHRLAMAIGRQFPDFESAPQNAGLVINGPEALSLVPARRGEAVDEAHLKAQLLARLAQNNFSQPITLQMTNAAPAIEDHEVAAAKAFALKLLAGGLDFVYAEETFHLDPNIVRRLLIFTEQADPHNDRNKILGVALDSGGLRSYLDSTLAPVINQEARDARFSLAEDGNSAERVTQFSLPQQGRTLDTERTISHAAASLARQEAAIPLAVDVVNPAVSTSGDIEQLGLTSLLSVGESDFAGSPKNRVRNIEVGAARYHGLLLPPGREFSFNEFLGPVDAAHDFLPELVIKNNVTTPEYGGGLCQVSTTAFRAALNAGLEITGRRNHAYAVSYYGTPGLDATIYPPSTDLKFVNNTPSYILMQTKINGTKLLFEFWGTNDGREVQLAGPVTYDKEASGAVKAYVEQKVIRAGETIIDETFHSRYKSPKLFPKVLAANGEKN